MVSNNYEKAHHRVRFALFLFLDGRVARGRDNGCALHGWRGLFFAHHARQVLDHDGLARAGVGAAVAGFI